TSGDVVEFIGVSQTLEEVAAACDTIPYEIMARSWRTSGDVVEFIGVSQTLEEVAAACDTIPYEIMARS
ncbi:hypothetical protein VS873_24105, partial [Salmonella enterica subsp. enterica serovar Typhi]|nr:hypothetical protein [Salmonella enterica subsp. enterica serovar Typhi]